MKPDESIDIVLNALRASDPPQGYEVRIQEALRTASQQSHSGFMLNRRHPERSVAKPKDLLSSLMPQLWWTAACAAVLLVGLAVRSYTHSKTPHTTPAIAHANTPLTQPAVIVATKTYTPAIRQHPIHAAPIQKRDENLQLQRIEVMLQSHEYIPEPPMPLTQQERLVIRMMRRNTAQQLAEYTPDARARQLHEDAQAYHDYFAATPLDGQPIYVQPIEHPHILEQTQ